MKAAILEKLKSPLLVEEVELPDKLECGQVLVRVECSTICGAQIGEIDGVKGGDKYLPHLLGHEGCGYVEETGRGVTTVKVGSKVVMHWRKGIGIEAPFPKYYRNRDGKIIGGGNITTFNEYAVVSENRLTSIDEDVPSDIASLMGCAVTTALGLINNEAKLKIGQSIAILGCGGVGLNIIQGAAMVSANPIIAIDKSVDKLGLAKLLGATHVINTNKEELRYRIFEIIGKVDVFVDCTGNTSLIDEAFQSVASGGRMILVGQPKYSLSLILTGMGQNYCGKVLMDSQGGLTNPSVDIPRYLKLYEEGKLVLDKIITDLFRLDDINRAIELVKSGAVLGRALIRM